MKKIGLTFMIMFWCGCLIAQEDDSENLPSDSVGTPTNPALIHRDNEIMAIDLSIKSVGKAPKLVPTTSEMIKPTPMSPKSVEFSSANFSYRRLLFEQPLLERHGATRNQLTQPLVSGVHFFGRAVLVPLDLVTRRNQECDSSIGWGTPGSPNLNCRR